MSKTEHIKISKGATVDENERYDQICKNEFTEIKAVLYKMYGKLFEGNGQPPITVQLDRLNNFKKTICWVSGIVLVGLIGIACKWIYGHISG